MANGADHPLAGRSGGGFSRQVDTPRAGRRCSPPAGRIWCPNLVPLLRRGVSIADRMDGILVGTIGLRFPSRRRCGCEAWRRMAGNLAAISAIRPVKIRTAEIAIGPVATRPARTDLRNDPCTKRPQYHYTRYTPSSAAGLSLILRMDRSTSAMIRLLTRGDQLVDPLSGVQRRPVRHPAQSVGQLDQRIRRPGRLREYHPRWARGTGCTHSRRQRSGVPPGSRHPSRSS